MVRRLKSDLREISTDDFPDRQVIPEVIENLPEDAPELVISRLLQQYRELREARLAGPSPPAQRRPARRHRPAKAPASPAPSPCTAGAIDKQLAQSTSEPELSESTGPDDDRAKSQTVKYPWVSGARRAGRLHAD
jgi:hypothetical protein